MNCDGLARPMRCAPLIALMALRVIGRRNCCTQLEGSRITRGTAFLDTRHLLAPMN